MIDFVKKHNRDALAAAKSYAEDKPWRGDVDERSQKLANFCWSLCDAYSIDAPNAIVRHPDFGSGPADGWYDPEAEAIVLTGGFSVMAFLRLFAAHLEHMRGRFYSNGDINRYAARWANGLFKKAFPKSWAKLVERDAPILSRDYS
jgi:hypothetical protein